MIYHSILVILVPEVEHLVGLYRSKYDLSAADGMPAHVTINYPFLPIENDDSDIIDNLRQLFSSLQSFSFFFQNARRFPGVLYLEPSPSQPFIDLIQAVALRFPESPPYSGIYKDIVPHLTVATTDDHEALEDICHRFDTDSIGKLPIKAVVNEVWLMDHIQGAWTNRVSFALGEHH